MTHDQQLALWVAGDPQHNKTLDQCCPDFSCCRGVDHIAPEVERIAFRDANEATRDRMLFGFLGKAMANAGRKVYLAGDPDVEESGNEQ